MCTEPTDPPPDPNGHPSPGTAASALATTPLPISPTQQDACDQPRDTIYPFMFSKLRENDLDPTLNKTVKWLVNSDDDFIVYIDEDLYVEWNMNNNSMLDANTGPHLNRVGQLEAVDTTYLDRTRVESYKRMIAEGVSRVFEKNLDAAKTALDFAESWITSRNTEVARGWYLLGSGLTALVALVTAVSLGYWHASLRQEPYFNLMIGAAFGGIGAWLSVIQRTRTAGLDVAAGPILHYVEGAFRIMAGSLGAMLIAVAIRAGLYAQAERLSVIIVICMVAGVSERLVPSFIEQMESRTSGGGSEGKPSVPK